MSKYTEEQEDVEFSEPIVAQKGVKMKVTFAEKNEWVVKDKDVWNPMQKSTMEELLGKTFDACKLTLQIVDESVKTEHEDARAKLTIEDQFNIQSYPYPDKKTGRLKKLGRQKLYQLETALGFDPVFQVNGEAVEPFITKNGNKVAPKIEGVKRAVNEDFFGAYFNENGTPNMDNWAEKELYADIVVESSAVYGDRNSIGRYVKAPVM